MKNTFIHLRLHTEYSLADGTIRIRPLIARCHELGMPAIAVTDLVNVYGMVKFYQCAIAQGIKPIVGVDVWIENSSEPHAPHRLVLLCQDREGYRNLCHLLTRAYTEAQHGERACIRKSWLADEAAGLIALSGGGEGELAQALFSGTQQRVESLLDDFRTLFPDRFYVELQRVGRAREEEYIDLAMDLASNKGLPVVATNHVHFLNQEDYEAHEVRVCIHEGRSLGDQRRPRRYTDAQYLRSSQEMIALFDDIPEAIENTVEIAKRCNLELELGTPHLPDYPVADPGGVDTLLRKQGQEGLDKNLQQPQQGDVTDRRSKYQARLERELNVICSMGFAGYFLIVADFIHWAKKNDIPVGPGRGSGAGSLVAFSLGITEIDPLEHGLLFERFLNPERVSLPDFDIDFCIEGRDRVIEYVANRYGRDKVSQIITHGTMAAKAVVRDVGRVLDRPYGFVDQIAKLIPFEIGITLDKALEQEEQLRERYENEDDVREIIDTARSLEGLARNVGKHAGGVVIAPSTLTDYTPLYCEHGSVQTVTQLDKDDLETIGLVKFDFLGLRTLTVIDKTLKLVNVQRKSDGLEMITPQSIPAGDADTYALLKSFKTTALFQLESRGMRELIQQMQPDNFDDLVDLVALYRPGPLQSGMVEDFIKRKHGRAKIEYPHPDLEPILKPTYGVILYQEQVMQIAQVLAGYSLGAADILRRAMGKKKPEEMARQRAVFTDGAKSRDVSERTATYIFDLMEKFAGYGFNKSHSAAYALISYQTAWLKTHYPAAFMAASLSADMEHTDKVVRLIAECRDLKIHVLAPDVNRCDYAFVPTGDSEIMYGLGAIKGIGFSAIEAIKQAREAGGMFGDLFDFCQRIDPKRVNRRVLDPLIRAGALDELGPHRASLLATLPRALDIAGQALSDRTAGQEDLFGIANEQTGEAEFIESEQWSQDQRLSAEKESLGLYLTGHPIDSFREELDEIIDSKLVDLKPTVNRTIKVAGLIVALRLMNTRRREKMAFITLDDQTGRLELAVFADLFAQCRDQLRKDSLIVVEGSVSVDEYTGGFRMSADRILSIEEARAAFAKRLIIDVPEFANGDGFIHQLQDALKPYVSGECQVFLRYRTDAAEAALALGENWRVTPSVEALESLRRVTGEDHVRVLYH